MLTIGGVKVAGRLVCHHDRGLNDKGSRKRHSLLFSA